MRAALVAELLLAGQPQPQPRVLADRQPRAVVLAREGLELQELAIEALHALPVAHLQGELCESGGQHARGYGARRAGAHVPKRRRRTTASSSLPDCGSISSATRSKTLPTPGSAASRSNASAPPGVRAATRSSSPPSVVETSTWTVPSSVCAGAWAATASVNSSASSRRSIGHCARAASIPTTRPSTAATSGPFRTRTVVAFDARLKDGLIAVGIEGPRRRRRG